MSIDMIITLTLFGAFAAYCQYDKYVTEKENKRKFEEMQEACNPNEQDEEPSHTIVNIDIIIK